MFLSVYCLFLLHRFTFYDGPPFATGLPHYGHILAGTIKDIVTRFAHQNGFHVDRRFGWDCHGLPVVGGIFLSKNIVAFIAIDLLIPKFLLLWRTLLDYHQKW